MGNQCNIANYVIAVNAALLCGHNDWRMPARMELQGLLNLGLTDPAIDANYFPNTRFNLLYWSGTSYVDDPTMAWFVFFGTGYSYAHVKSELNFVRLVRGAP